MTTEDGDVVWMFDPPPGDDLTIVLDARIEPGVFGREDGHTTVTAEGATVTSRVHDLGGSLMGIVIRSVVIYLFLWLILRARSASGSCRSSRPSTSW